MPTPTVTLTLTRSQLLALRSLVAEHLLCPRRSEIYVDCSSWPSVETTHEELLARLMEAWELRQPLDAPEDDPR